MVTELTGDMVVATTEQVRDYATAVLQRLGVPDDHAGIIADALCWADLRGIPAQGIAKLPIIVDRMKAGATAIAAEVVTIGGKGAFAALDANQAWGHVAGVHGMRAAIERAREFGVGAAVVRNTTSGSAMGYYAMLAVAEGMIGIALNDTVPLQAPWGGRSKVLGNQAFAMGAPAGARPAVLFDAATTAISWTGIDHLREQGLPLPEGCALDADGEPTTDPAAALAGYLLPMGGHRGYGITLMWEILTGVLGGAERFGPTITPLSDLGRPQSVSHFMMAIDTTVAVSSGQFADRVGALIDHIHASPPAPGVDRVLVPGERGFETAATRGQTGIPIPAEVAAQLRTIGDELGVGWLP